MRIEIRCAACGKGYLVDEARIPASGGVVPCHACGQAIRLKPREASRAESRPAPVQPPPRPEAAAEVSCPRCGLHFVPGTRDDAPTAARPRLLLVEDMDYFIEIARDALAGRYDVKSARTLEEARAAVVQGGIDLLLLDLTLEGGEDGLRLLREAPGKTCPVLLFTAHDESEMYGDGWERLRALGVDDVVIKGMNMGETLSRKVAALLGEPQPEDSFRR